eukprot:snap_masked-scaffold_4-processed-gene-5.22-mRNA-1 protein AED:1.00 eAED:1.00 QI:0/-1/0/0/-1/1/1/0/62
MESLHVGKKIALVHLCVLGIGFDKNYQYAVDNCVASDFQWKNWDFNSSQMILFLLLLSISYK